MLTPNNDQTCVLVTQSCLTPCGLHCKQILYHLSYQGSPLDGTWLRDNSFLQLSWGKEGRSLKVLGSPEKEATPEKLNQRWRGALSLMTSLGSQTWTGPPTPGPFIHEAHHRWFCPCHLNSWWGSRYPDFGSVQTRGWTLADVDTCRCGRQASFPLGLHQNQDINNWYNIICYAALFEVHHFSHVCPFFCSKI